MVEERLTFVCEELVDNSSPHENSSRSLRRLINQLKEEIARCQGLTISNQRRLVQVDGPRGDSDDVAKWRKELEAANTTDPPMKP